MTVVTRGTRASRIAGFVAVPAVVLLAALPYLVVPNVTRTLVDLFALIVLATMWNLLAGYGGMISVGQQGFIGLGAYTVVVAGLVGIDPFLALPLAAGLLALPTTLLVFRLSGGYFAIGMWVVAEVIRLVTVEFAAVGGGAGASVSGLAGLGPTLRGAITYWCALAVVVVAVGAVFLVLRSRLGLALDGLRVQPEAVYGVQWSAFMIFMVVIGGLGTIEGPILGAIVFFALQQLLLPHGAWYLVVLGIVAIAAALYARRGGC